MGVADLAPTIFSVLRELAGNPSAAVTGALRDLTTGVADEVARVTREARAIVADAEAAVAAAATELHSAQADFDAQVIAATADFQARVAAAEQVVAAAAGRGADEIAAARQQAQQLRAGALAAAPDPDVLDAAERRAEQLIATAEEHARQLTSDAQALLSDLDAAKDAKLAELQKLLTDASKKVDEATGLLAALGADAATRVDDEIARLKRAAEQAAAQVTAVPGQAVALAEDARRAIVGALEQEASLMGLVTQALVFLKDELFGGEPKLQVVAYSHPNAPSPGIGLSWVDGDVTALLAYAPDLGGPLGSLVIATSRAGGGPIDISTGSPVSIGLRASGSQSTVITFGAPAVPAADVDVELFANFDLSSLAVDERFLQAQPGRPTVNVRIRFTGGVWHYKASGALSNAQWGVDFARLLQPIPNLFPFADFGEKRTFGVSLEDGVFAFVESDAA